MKFLPVVLTALALAAPQQSSDITIRTRSTYGPRGAIETVTVQLKGQRQRFVRHIDVRQGGGAMFTDTTISQCDVGRMVMLNEAAKLYAVEPIPTDVTLRASGRVISGHSLIGVQDTRPVVEVRTMDAVDTGERRAYGPFVARHVITTTTVEREGAAAVVAGIRDGWYIDLPPVTCKDTGYTAAGLVMREGGGRVEIKSKGTGRVGFAIEERDRMMDAPVHLEHRTELLEFSEAPLAPALFEIPEGYTPALRVPFYGHYDLSRPDTLLNRASALWSFAANWARQWWWW
jgi:hypothetical protein